MPSSDSAELKRRLRAAGFEIYRTRGREVVLAERIRDNLIMDSGVAAVLADDGGSAEVVVVVRAQATHFPGGPPEALMDHVRALASAFEARGYSAGEALTREMNDPGNPERTLDTSLEMHLRRRLASEKDVFEELRTVLAMPRSSSDG